MRRWIAAIGAALAALGAGAASAEPVRDGREGRVAVELAPETAGVAPGGTVHVALRQRIDRGWHTYWRNAGDSGEPTRVTWTLPAGWQAGEIVWPTPSRQSASETILNYGYDGEVYLPVPIQVPATARPGETVTLKVAAAWLVCKDICIPEDATLEVSVPVVAGTPEPHPEFGPAVARTIAAAPKPAGLTAGYVREGEALKVAAIGPALAGADFAGAYFFPFDGAAITHAAPQSVERGLQGVTLTIAPGYAFQGGAPPTSLAGVLALGDGTAFEIDAVGGSLPAGAAGLGAPVARAADGGGGDGIGLPLALGLALLGGLVLNLMPCVFPVLAMKAASLAGHAGETRAARLRGLAFAAGVVATFLALAGALIAFRAAGEAVGWGFQLQSPAVVAGLALLMLLIALNLSGVFEVGGGVQNLGSGGAGRQDALGAFLTGALAVVVAAPCTAPFMAGALGYALTQPPAVSLLVFAALAVGFAAPFTALSFAPGLLARLPRPGPWMDGFRKLLAFPMYGTALWLTWVVTNQAGTQALAALFAAGLLSALAVWGYGVSQRLPRLSPRTGYLAAAVVFIAALSAVGVAATDQAGAQRRAVAAGEAIPSEAYSPARLATLRAEGRPVFVNFTADWCVTCKVNERAALASADVASAFQDEGVVYLKGDWTRRDDVIAAALAEHGRSGVPLYLLYTPGASSPKVLPQLLTEGAVVAALRAASPAS